MNSVAIGSVTGSETHLNKGSVAARILPGFFPAISPKRPSLSPLALDGCRTAGINASDTKLITPTEIHTLDGQETMGPG